MCSYGWDLSDAQVVCRQLGYPGMLDPLTSPADSHGGIRGSPIWWANVRCTGGESRIEAIMHTCLGIVFLLIVVVGMSER